MSPRMQIDDGPSRAVAVTRFAGHDASVWIDNREHRARLSRSGDAFELRIEHHVESIWVCVEADVVFLHAFGRAWEVAVADPSAQASEDAERDDVIVAPMPGGVIAVAAAAGESVEVGDPLLVIESMKMQNEIVAWRDGVVDRVFLRVGETFERGARLVALEPRPDRDDDGPLS